MYFLFNSSSTHNISSYGLNTKQTINTHLERDQHSDGEPAKSFFLPVQKQIQQNTTDDWEEDPEGNMEKKDAKSAVQEYVEKKCIKIQHFSNIEDLSVEKTYYVSKRSLKIKLQTEKQVCDEQLQKIYKELKLEEQSKEKPYNQGNVSYKNKIKLIFGRSKPNQNTIENKDTTISQKHLMVQPSEQAHKEDQKIVNFILCVKKASSKSNLSMVSNMLVKEIVGFVKKFQHYLYNIRDMKSKNGAYFRIKENQVLTEKNKVEYIIGEQEVKIRCQRNFQSPFLYDQEGLESLEHWMKSLQNYDKLIQFNDLNQSKNEKEHISAIVLRMKTKFKTFTFFLTNLQTKYYVFVENLSIYLKTQLPENSIPIALISYQKERKQWKIEQKKGWIQVKMNQNISYGIQSKTYIRLGSKNYYSIMISK